ncbi:MAG: putative metal-binding motif-containing protein [Gammaproteobacteria bacterium]|nr:putative metal-binding motif-containing protein [Gammaproteobacteria bacterium]
MESSGNHLRRLGHQTTRLSLRSILWKGPVTRLFTVLSVCLAVNVSAGDNTVKCWKASDFDLDGDGYAAYYAHKNDRIEVDTTDQFALSCPAGWVKARGDCDDSDPSVHPRRNEVFGNYTDDNCDGRVDEPTFLYTPDGYSVYPTGVAVRIRLHDADVVDAYQSSTHELLVQLEYQRLDDTGSTMTSGYHLVDSMTVGWNYAIAETYLGGLQPDTPYRIRARFFERPVPLGLSLQYATESMARHSAYAATITTNGSQTTIAESSTRLVDARLTGLEPVIEPISTVHHSTAWLLQPGLSPVGEQSGWYYTMTGSYSAMGNARGALVRRALYEAYLSSVGYTGYLGWLWQDGTRYGADVGEAWCSEFYSWVAAFELDTIGHRSNVSKLRSYFQGFDAFIVVDDPLDFVATAEPGDYLAMDTNDDGQKNHSAMFMAVDAATDRVWSVDGNVSGSSDIGGSYASRRAGNEAFVLSRELEVVRGLGLIEFGMLK